MNSLNGKVVMITGATGNLGQAVTSAFASAGAELVLVSRHVSEKLSHDTEGLCADVTMKQKFRG